MRDCLPGVVLAPVKTSHAQLHMLG